MACETDNLAKIKRDGEYVPAFNLLMGCANASCGADLEVLCEANASDLGGATGDESEYYGRAQYRLDVPASADRRVIWKAPRFARLGQHLEADSHCGIVAYDQTLTADGWTDQIICYNREPDTGADSSIAWRLDAAELVPDLSEIAWELTEHPEGSNHPECIGSGALENYDTPRVVVSYCGKSHNGLVPVFGWVQGRSTVPWGELDEYGTPVVGAIYYWGWAVPFITFVRLDSSASERVVSILAGGGGWGFDGGWWGGEYTDAFCDPDNPPPDNYYGWYRFSALWGWNLWWSSGSPFKRPSTDLAYVQANAIMVAGQSWSAYGDGSAYIIPAEVSSCGWSAWMLGGGNCWAHWTNPFGFYVDAENQTPCFMFGEDGANYYLPLDLGGVAQLCKVTHPSGITAPTAVLDENDEIIRASGGRWHTFCGLLYGIGVVLEDAPDDSSGGVGEWVVRHDLTTKQTFYLPAANLGGLYEAYIIKDSTGGGIGDAEQAECLELCGTGFGDCCGGDPASPYPDCCVPLIDIFAANLSPVTDCGDGQEYPPHPCAYILGPYTYIGTNIHLWVRARLNQSAKVDECADDCIVGMTVSIGPIDDVPIGDARPPGAESARIAPCETVVVQETCDEWRREYCFMVPITELGTWWLPPRPSAPHGEWTLWVTVRTANGCTRRAIVEMGY
jgi:hypothetical protein